MDDDIGIRSQSVVESIVLKMSGVKMSACVLIDSVFTDDFSKIVHSEEIGVVPAGSDEGGAD